MRILGSPGTPRGQNRNLWRTLLVWIWTVPHRIMYLNTWSSIVGVLFGEVMELLGSGAFWRKYVIGGGLWSSIAQSHFLFSLCFQSADAMWECAASPTPCHRMACFPTELGANPFFKALWSGILLQQHVKSLLQGVTVQRIQVFLLQPYVSVLHFFSSYCWDKTRQRKAA